jgi:hypothetical protein
MSVGFSMCFDASVDENTNEPIAPFLCADIHLVVHQFI